MSITQAISGIGDSGGGGGGSGASGSGSANQVTYWTGPSSVSGNTHFLFDPSTSGFAVGADAILGVAASVSRQTDFSSTITDAATDSIFGNYTKYTYTPTADVSNTVVAGFEYVFSIPSSNTKNITSFGTSCLEALWYNEGSGNVQNGFALFAAAEHRGTGAVTSELGAIYFNSQCNSLGGITGTAFKDGNFGCAGQSGAAAGNIKRDYTFYAESPSHTGTMDQHRGLYMEDQEFGTESWAIQTTGGKVEFGAPSGKNSLIYMQDSDVAHGITSLVPTDIYGAITSISATAGGLGVLGISDTDAIGLSGFGYIGTTSPSNTTASIQFKGGKKNGANLQDLGTGDVLFSLINNSATSSPNLWVLGGGSIGVRTQFPSARLDISSATSDSSASSFRVTDSGDGTAITVIRNDKRIGIGTSTLNSTAEIASKVASSDVTKLTTFTSAAHTGITASTEANWFDVNLGQTHTWATGNVTTQRGCVIRSETIAAAGASTFTNAATFAITGAPSAGSNVTITNPYSVWVQGGTSRFDGMIDLSGVGSTGAILKATATSDTPAVSFSAIGTFIPTTAPAGYLEINIAGNARFIPFWA